MLFLSSPIRLASHLFRSAARLLRGLLLVGLALVLSSCADYDSAIQFNSPSSGMWTQQLRVNLASDQSQALASALTQRLGPLGGHLNRAAPETLEISVPFSSGTDLEQKFTEFFEPGFEDLDLPNLTAHLTNRRNNFVLMERSQLHYDLDLRPLGMKNSTGGVLLAPNGLQVNFGLATPLGAQVISASGLEPMSTEPRALTWQLTPGQLNQIDAVFWLPSPVGIGSVAIAGLVGGGLAAQSRRNR
jgi:hypothetical protein